jgi:hypothetical protein
MRAGCAGQQNAIIDACRAINIDVRPFFRRLSAMPAYKAYARNCPLSQALSSSGHQSTDVR